MILKTGLMSGAGALALIFSCSPAFAEPTTLGDVRNTGQLVFQEGVLDFSATPFPVSYTYSVDKFFAVAPDQAINEAISDSQRSASVTVSQGVIKAAAASTGISGANYVHAAGAAGAFVDSFSLTSSDPGVEWVPITVTMFLDGSIQTPGGTNNYNRGFFRSFIEVVTAPGSQQGDSWSYLFDFERGGFAQVDQACVFTPGQQSCGRDITVGYDHDVSVSGYTFTYQTVVKANEQFTLLAGMSAGAASLAAGEWSHTDFSHTAIFGGIQVGAGISVMSSGTGSALNIKNGIANYDAAFEALTEKYGVATPGVPEPGTWAMMISGFAIAGAMMRRRVRISFA